ncbi:hypothetical protein [Micromonospora sp. NPDC047074]|uniref:hypothetical protein n=1 Tax=Micromonospora sp. NPDC047074 TaxID=3154339 RepID=UPI00340A6A4F
MTSRSWEALVVEAKRMHESNRLDRWAIGDLAIEAIPPGKTRAERSAVQEKLKEFSAATGLSLSLLKDCHRTSEKWPSGMRIPDISHAKHSRYASRPNRLSLLLNDETDDGLSARIREKVEKAESLLSDPELRQALTHRSKSRSRHLKAAAKAIEDEELIKARIALRIQEQDARAQLAAPEILAKAEERAIKANLALARMVTELLDLKSVTFDIPPAYRERTTEYVSQVHRAALQVLDKLRPEERSPQPRIVIIDHDEQPGAEHP